MADRSLSLDAFPRVPIARRSRRNAPSREPAPELGFGSGSVSLAALPAAAIDVRSGPVRRPVDRPDRRALLPAGFPLLRRTRLQRTRLERLLGGSAIAHALLITALAILFARQPRLQAPPEASAVQMVYGSSGLTGANSPDQASGGKPQQQAAPPTPPEPQVNTNLPDMAPPLRIPDFVPPDLPPPPPVPPKQQLEQQHNTRIPLQRAPQKTTRTNPFSHPMDLSFSQEGTPRPRTGQAGGSGAPIDLSLGPLVKNGEINTPFANIGVKGVSSDYGNELDSWIRRHLYYPPDAAQRGEQGPSHVHVQIDRSGHVKSVRLLDSSGSFALDSATTGMFRGRTLPPVPPDMQGDHFDIDLTVNYILEH